MEGSKTVGVRFTITQISRITRCLDEIKKQKRVKYSHQKFDNCDFIREGVMLYCDVIERKKFIDEDVVEAFKNWLKNGDKEEDKDG